MRRLSLLLLFIFTLTVNLVQAQEAKKLFVNMPDSLLPLLTPVNRADFIDFLESNMKAEVKNKFGNNSEMTDLTRDYIKVGMSSTSQWQMKVLAANDSIHIIGTISTACAPVCDSNIQFFTTEWKELPVSSYIQLPVLEDFFSTPDSAQMQTFNNASLKADMLLMKAEFNKENSQLLFTFNTPEYLDEESQKELEAFTRKTIAYDWRNGRFERVN